MDLFQRLLWAVLSVIIVALLALSITFGILWKRSPPSSSTHVDESPLGYPLDLNPSEYVQWTILQLNDVYEIIALDEGRRGGLARVAQVREMLLKENPRTLTILAGDFLSPSAMSQSIVNGSALNAKQMISTLNHFGLDLVTFGNHEFDLTEIELERRIAESKFDWIATNVIQTRTNRSFDSTVPFKIISIDGVRILFLGLCIDVIKPYAQIVNQSSLVPFVEEFLRGINRSSYDVLIALTHLDLLTDLRLSEKLPQLDLILGGHEHDNIHLFRGPKLTPIVKADANAFSVYIHRCAFHRKRKEFRVYSTFAELNEKIPLHPSTNQLAQSWFNLAMQGFEQIGFQPQKIVSCLPQGFELDGRSASVRNVRTQLADDACQSLLQATKSKDTSVGVFHSGSIRIDDVLRGKITEYDVLRIFPYQDPVHFLRVNSSTLANLLSRGWASKGSGSFLSYCGIDTPDQGQTWVVNGTDITSSQQDYRIATIDYLKRTDPSLVNPLEEYQFNQTQTQVLITYFQEKYPPC